MARRDTDDLYAQLRRNRMRLAEAVTLHSLLAMGLSALTLHFALQAAAVGPGFWFWLVLLWLLFLLYALLRYALGGRWIFRSLVVLSPWQTDVRLTNALDAAALASGMRSRIRLFCIPNPDINSFCLSLPDGTFALFATSGIAEKLPERERVAIVAHETAHMMAGDASLYTVMLRLTGRRALRRTVSGADMRRDRPLRVTGSISSALVFFLVALLFFDFSRNLSAMDETFRKISTASQVRFAAVLILLCLLFAVSLPPVMHKLLQLLLDRRREYAADLQAAYLSRDPEAVYLALKHAAEDVRDVMILSACFDALLFHPVVDYTSYNPFGTQPTMADRMRRLRDSFPRVFFEESP
ncbi:MAG: hypothetical protein QME88_01405 [Actinomycetota bacterium]|nr:hypothetical protein [Actinomycetota bacterium]